ncbi:unnamed protein product [Eretmochelys imbricata]
MTREFAPARLAPEVLGAEAETSQEKGGGLCTLPHFPFKVPPPREINRFSRPDSSSFGYFLRGGANPKHRDLKVTSPVCVCVSLSLSCSARSHSRMFCTSTADDDPALTLP